MRALMTAQAEKPNEMQRARPRTGSPAVGLLAGSAVRCNAHAKPPVLAVEDFLILGDPLCILGRLIVEDWIGCCRLLVVRQNGKSGVEGIEATVVKTCYRIPGRPCR